MADNQEEIDNLNNKLVELYGRLNRIKYNLDKMDVNNAVEAKSANRDYSTEIAQQGRIQVSKRPNK